MGTAYKDDSVDNINSLWILVWIISGGYEKPAGGPQYQMRGISHKRR